MLKKSIFFIKLTKPIIWIIFAGLVFFTCSHEPPDDFSNIDNSQKQPSLAAKIAFIQGTVRIKRAHSNDWVPAVKNQKLSSNDKLHTLKNSFATIELENGAILKIGPNTLVAVSDLKRDKRRKLGQYTIMLEKGKVEADLDSEKAASGLTIKTPSAEANFVPREVSFQ
jgi:hypothetical protein